MSDTAPTDAPPSEVADPVPTVAPVGVAGSDPEAGDPEAGGPEAGSDSETGEPEAGEPEADDPDADDPYADDSDANEVDADLARLVTDVERLQGEREEMLDQLLRARADFDNYRKRMVRQHAEQAERGAEELIGKLLEVLDVFDAAQAHGQGFEQACGRLAVLLEKEGLVRIDPVGSPFDPTEADAVAHEPSEEQADGPVVSAVLRAGYRWKGRVLRPAMVKVRG